MGEISRAVFKSKILHVTFLLKAWGHISVEMENKNFLLR